MGSLDISTAAFWWIFNIMQGLSIVLIIQLFLHVPDINSATLTELKGLAPDGSQAKHVESEVETEPPAIEEQDDAKAPSNERRLMKSVSMMSSLTEVCKSVKAENATNCACAKKNDTSSDVHCGCSASVKNCNVVNGENVCQCCSKVECESKHRDQNGIKKLIKDLDFSLPSFDSLFPLPRPKVPSFKSLLPSLFQPHHVISLGPVFRAPHKVQLPPLQQILRDFDPIKLLTTVTKPIRRLQSSSRNLGFSQSRLWKPHENRDVSHTSHCFMVKAYAQDSCTCEGSPDISLECSCSSKMSRCNGDTCTCCLFNTCQPEDVFRF